MKRFQWAILSLTMLGASAPAGEVTESIRLVPHTVGYSTIQPMLINGSPVEPGTWKQVVRIRTGNASCSASVVGPRVLATAAHCADTGATSVFKIDGVEYRAKMTRNPLYGSKDLDLALGLIDQEVTGIPYGQLPGRVDVVKKGMAIRLMGYGCVNPGGGGGNDGVLREGLSAVTGFSNFDLVTQKSGGSALCFGDSGGPAWLEVEEGGRLVKVNISQNSKGDIQKTSYLTRWDVKEAQDWARKWATDNGAEICGLSRDCSETEPPPAGGSLQLASDKLDVKATIRDHNLARNPEYVRQVLQNAIDFLQ